jgi:ATP-dependent 26S proteasome regulatory subunit
VPAPQDRVLLLRQFLRGFDTTALNLESLAGKLDLATGADIESLCVEAARLALLEGRNSLSREDVQAALNSYRERSKITQELKRQIEE